MKDTLIDKKTNKILEKNENSIIGFFISSNIDDLEYYELELENYIWHTKHSLRHRLSKLNYNNYGSDVELILLQFYIKPIEARLQKLPNIESYQKKDKSIGIPIIINNENFFNKSEEERYIFLKQTILHKLDLLAEVVKNKKLDTNVALLIRHVNEIL